MTTRASASTSLDEVGAAVTGCALAIAETGTLVFDAGARQGRRALTLVPDLHLCVVEATQVVDGVPAAMRRLAPDLRGERRPVTFVSGPSATSDIELSRVEGVHGPRRLELVVVTRLALALSVLSKAKSKVLTSEANCRKVAARAPAKELQVPARGV